MLRSVLRRASNFPKAFLLPTRAYATSDGDPLNIYIDRSGLIQWKEPSTASELPASFRKEEETALARHLKALIQVRAQRHVHVKGLQIWET